MLFLFHYHTLLFQNSQIFSFHFQNISDYKPMLIKHSQTTGTVHTISVPFLGPVRDDVSWWDEGYVPGTYECHDVTIFTDCFKWHLFQRGRQNKIWQTSRRQNSLLTQSLNWNNLRLLLFGHPIAHWLG